MKQVKDVAGIWKGGEELVAVGKKALTRVGTGLGIDVRLLSAGIPSRYEIVTMDDAAKMARINKLRWIHVFDGKAWETYEA